MVMNLDFSVCEKCGGDGIKAVPTKNVFKIPMPHNSNIIPNYFVVFEKCECKNNETQN